MPVNSTTLPVNSHTILVNMHDNDIDISSSELFHLSVKDPFGLFGICFNQVHDIHVKIKQYKPET